MTWQSRGSAIANEGAFQQIATAPDVHVYLAVVSIEAIGNSVPRNDITTMAKHRTFFYNATLDLLQIDLVLDLILLSPYYNKVL